MNQSVSSFLISQIGYQGPSLLVYLFAIAIAPSSWDGPERRRY